MSKMWLLRHKKGRSSHNCCLYQFFKIYFENKILKNENFDHPEKNELFCLQTNLFVKNSFYMTINYICVFDENWNPLRHPQRNTFF